MGLAVWVVGASRRELASRLNLFRGSRGASLRRAAGLPRGAWGMTISHAAAGMMVAGITASGVWQTEVVRYMKAGDRADVAGYSITFKGVHQLRSSNYLARQGIFAVVQDGVNIATLRPEKRIYLLQRMPTTEAAIRTNLLADLYVVLGDPNNEGGYAVRLYHNPLVAWIWIGAILMFLGGVVSLTDRRHRVGAPRRSTRSIAAPLAKA